MIQCSAIIIRGEYPILIAGKRHCDCLDTARKLGIDRLEISSAIQGFLTTRLAFLPREMAAQDALKCDQIKELKYSKTELYSEDLY